MKPTPTKSQIRAELQQQIQHYLQDGGAVNKVPRGISGHDGNTNPFSHYGEKAPTQSRTPVNEQIKAMDARKQKHAARPPRPKKPQKKLIVDDFGEPLRWVWVDE